jgi:pimeloyl-ACP methyl ester carboxylesterase
LGAETAREMTRRGPQAELVEFEGCGHAPALMDEAQIKVVHEWLAQGIEDEEDEAADATARG